MLHLVYIKKITPSIISGRYYDRILFCRQNTLLSDRIQFCPTEYTSVRQNTILSTEFVMLQTAPHSLMGSENSRHIGLLLTSLYQENNAIYNQWKILRQNCILSTEYNSVLQNTILSNRIVFCLTEVYSVGQNCNLSTEYNSVRQNTLLSDRIQFC